MTETQKIRYEILMWAWYQAKKYEDEEDGIQQFRDHIGKFLKIIADKGDIEFEQLLDKLKKETASDE